MLNSLIAYGDGSLKQIVNKVFSQYFFSMNRIFSDLINFERSNSYLLSDLHDYDDYSLPLNCTRVC